VGILRRALDVISIAIFYPKLIQCYPNTQLRRGDFDKYAIENARGAYVESRLPIRCYVLRPEGACAYLTEVPQNARKSHGCQRWVDEWRQASVQRTFSCDDWLIPSEECRL